ncbi:RnfABCDGE type electron transport complex subunit D [Breznakiella homolactica]|uniref:RnfABCDGE type electron transport complex subunit D n=1 Tax=Breznakiella homolactica TaxID=2798577 RepID=A0A7T7XK89_9SPIR|nr:RnfABCDGE type electron transport complex subunit D [Breznakiella homolactica]QQO07950.1 RnfABCDGE type electron transport complex subunit D [Breznakiella homolactica]
MYGNDSLNQRPQVNLARSTSRRMWLVCLCAGFAVIQSAVTEISTLYIAAAAVIGALGTELLLNIRSNRNVLKDGSALATALILTVMLPNTLHPVLAALGAAFAVGVVKYSFGGLGANWLNPALAGWLFIRFSWPVLFAGALSGSILNNLYDAVMRGGTDAQGSPLGILSITGYPVSHTDTMVTGTLNSTILSFTGAKLPGGYVNLFLPYGTGIIADRGLLALLIGTILITASQVNRVWIPALYLFVYGLLIRVFGALPFGGDLWNGDILFGFCTGGTMVAAFLLIADPVTGAKSNMGIGVSVTLCALLSYVFRYIGMESYGAFFAVALVNSLVPLLRGLESRLFYDRRRLPV